MWDRYGSLHHDLIPSRRLSDNKVGMYDSAQDLFYTNLGTGEFGYEKLDGTYVAPV